MEPSNASPPPSVGWWHLEEDPEKYATRRLYEPVGGSALWAAIALPLARQACLRPLTKGLEAFLGLYLLRPYAPRLASFWLPSRVYTAATLGVLGGLLEDYHCKLVCSSMPTLRLTS